MADLDRLEPCGEANAAAMLHIDDAEVLDARVLKGEHLRLTVRHGDRRFDAFGFGLASAAPPVGEHVAINGGLRRDSFRGRTSIEIRIANVHRLHQ